MNPWTDLGNGIRVRQSRLFWMNSTLLLHAEHAVIVDPGALPSELDDLARAVHDSGAADVTLVFTHAHWDHVLGRRWWPEARTIAHDRFADELARDLAHIRAEAERGAAEAGEAWSRAFEPFRPKEAVSGLRFMRVGPWRLVLRDAFGHCDSQLSVHLPEQRVLIAADMLSDIEIPILNAPCAVYRRTLQGLALVAEGRAIETLVPGHGSIARGTEAATARLRHDLDYLETLERGVRDARAAGLTLEAAQQRLATMDYAGRDAAYSMVDIHKRNVQLAYEGVAAARPGRTPRSAAARLPATGR